MTRTRMTITAVAALLVSAAPLFAQADNTSSPLVKPSRLNLPADQKQALTQWEDYIHGLHIAQDELALANGAAVNALTLSPDVLLRLLEEISIYKDFERTLRRASRRQGDVGKMAVATIEMIRKARFALAKDGKRIRESIEKLDDGLRARMNAQERLARAGEYAAPELLKVLESSEKVDADLRPYVIRTIEKLGRPLVVPLCEALPDTAPVVRQQIASMLGTIGYPVALPYLKREIERKDNDAATVKVTMRAYTSIVEKAGLSVDTAASHLFLRLAEAYYQGQESLVLEPGKSTNLLWSYNKSGGLSFMEIPTRIYGDVQSMRASKRALKLDRNLSAAMSLWVMANFRRENRLGSGTDPSYGSTMQSPHFYATLAGPKHLQPILKRALNERDAELALDAIRALAFTSDPKELLNLGGGTHPLITALNYPDRRVRFEAAFTVARSMPRTDFSGAGRVVQVLSEATREDGKPVAVVIAPDQTELNRVAALVRGAGSYNVLIGNSLEVVAEQVANAPGVDLIVVSSSVNEALATVTGARQHYKLMSTPIVALADEQYLPTLRRTLENYSTAMVNNKAATKEQLTTALTAAVKSSRGKALTAAEAMKYATTALGIIADLKTENGKVFVAGEAKPALLATLSDARAPVVEAGANVLATFKEAELQQAIADAAIAGKGGAALQSKVLRALAKSARAHGNQLNEFQLRKLVDLLGKAKGTLADAAAEAHGALNLPTSNAIDLITK